MNNLTCHYNMRKNTLNLFSKTKIIPVPYVLMEQKLFQSKNFEAKQLAYERKHLLYREKNYNIIRPLLNCSRFLLTKLCEHSKLPVYPDKSNQIVQYSRNRIRKQIIPSLKIFFNPQVEDAIFRFAEHIIKHQ